VIRIEEDLNEKVPKPVVTGFGTFAVCHYWAVTLTIVSVTETP